MPDVVSNAGPIIALTSVGQLDLLRLLFEEVVIPLMAKASRHIPAVKVLVEHLGQEGFRMSADLRDEILKQAGELA